MRLTAWLPLAVLSALATSAAATHPRYGGTLRAEIRAADPEAGPLAALVFEPVVRLDAKGDPQPWLALAWQPAGGKRWQFTLRPGVKLHNGTTLTPDAVASALPGMAISANGDAVVIRAEHGLPNLLLELAHLNVVASGPFRLTALESGRRATFAANEDYWGGRPFVDAVEVQLGRPLRDQFTDLELGKTDIAEIGPADARRAADHGRTVWSSAAVNLIALEAAPGRLADARLREALALAIDRAAMHNVLLQKQGEITAALLPEWLSGYAFLFPAARDLERARALANALPPAAREISLSYDPAMPVARALAERLAVNAHDAGITLRVAAQNPQADLRLDARRFHEFDPARALSVLAPGANIAGGGLATIYEAERQALDDFRLIPLFYLPDLYAAAGRVRNYGPSPITRLGDWRFENLWLSAGAP